MTKYRYDIGLDKYPYGTEIEFVKASLLDLEKAFQKTDIPIILTLNHKGTDTVYDRNYLDTDGTVSYEEQGNIYGGEISSRLYHNKKEDWLELNQICEILRNNHAEINGHCSNHINIKLDNVKHQNKVIGTLSQLIALYEKDIDLFYMGAFFLIRNDKHKYASSLSSYLIEKVNTIDFENDDNYLYKLLYSEQPTFYRKSGINLQDLRVDKRMEIRYPNGTLNEKIIQNNINFSLKLVNAIDEEKFDSEMLTRKIKEKLQTGEYWYDFLTEEESYKDFEFLVSTISTSSEDQNDFMSQYEKVLSTKSQVKKGSI